MAGGYSREEMNRMQSDAVRRVREMQSRAQRSIAGNGTMDFGAEKHRSDSRGQTSGQHHPSGSRDREPHPPEHLPQKRGKGFDILNMLNLKSLKLNSDTIIIIMVLLMMAGESSDELLMLALVYILI